MTRQVFHVSKSEKLRRTKLVFGKIMVAASILISAPTLLTTIKYTTIRMWELACKVGKSTTLLNYMIDYYRD